MTKRGDRINERLRFWLDCAAGRSEQVREPFPSRKSIDLAANKLGLDASASEGRDLLLFVLADIVFGPPKPAHASRPGAKKKWDEAKVRKLRRDMVSAFPEGFPDGGAHTIARALQKSPKFGAEYRDLELGTLKRYIRRKALRRDKKEGT
jgi:hypothetical protein